MIRRRLDPFNSLFSTTT